MSVCLLNSTFQFVCCSVGCQNCQENSGQSVAKIELLGMTQAEWVELDCIIDSNEVFEEILTYEYKE